MKLPFLIRKLLQKIFKNSMFLYDNASLFYLMGAEALPSPLTPEEEIYYVGLAENCETSESAKCTLIEHNLRLVVYISKKFENTGVEIEDLISVGSIGLIKAVNSFKGDKNIKLATYASRCIENEILMHLRKTVKLKNEVSLNEPLNKDSDGNELVLSDILAVESDTVTKNLEMSAEKKVLNNLLSKLNKREEQIISLRFGLNGKEEQTQKEIADSLGISQSYISRIEKKVISKLKKELAKVF